MNISNNGLDLIKKYEGLNLDVYVCPGGIRSIGYGHALENGETLTEITEDKAEEFLRSDVKFAEDAVNKYVKVPLDQGKFDALVSLIYNWGIGNFLRSMGLKKLNNGDYQGAIEEFKQVIRAKNKVLPGLVTRRNAEAELWNATA